MAMKLPARKKKNQRKSQVAKRRKAAGPEDRLDAEGNLSHDEDDDAAAPAGPKVWGDEEMAELLQNANDAQRDATASAYSTHLRKLEKICKTYGKDPFQLYGEELAKMGVELIKHLHRKQYASTTVGNASSMIRWLCTQNRMRMNMTEDIKNAGDHEFFRVAVRAARKAVKGSGPRHVLASSRLHLAQPQTAGAAATAAGLREHQPQLSPFFQGLRSDAFALAQPQTAAETAAAEGLRERQPQLSPFLQGLRSDAFALAQPQTAGAAETAAAAGYQSPASKQRAAVAAITAEMAAACGQHPSLAAAPVSTKIPALQDTASTKGARKGGNQGPSLAVWPAIEGLHLVPGQKPWTNEPATLNDLFDLFCSGVKIGDKTIVPPWLMLYSMHGDKWYPANDKSLRKRIGELKHLYDVCIVETSKLRSCTPKEAAAFWTKKQQEHAALTASRKLQALKVYWENIVNPLRKDRSQFEAYVAKQRPPDFVSPTKGALERRRIIGTVAATDTAAPSSLEGANAAMEAGTSGEQGDVPPAAAVLAVEGPLASTRLKKAPHSGMQMFVGHIMRTARVSLSEAAVRWNGLQGAEQDEWNQKCKAAKQAFMNAVANEAL